MIEEDEQDYHQLDRLGSRSSRKPFGQNNFDYLISVMKNITQNLIDPSNTLYNPAKYDPKT